MSYWVKDKNKTTNWMNRIQPGRKTGQPEYQKISPGCEFS